MRVQTVLLVLVLMALLVTLGSGCFFGGKKDEGDKGKSTADPSKGTPVGPEAGGKAAPGGPPGGGPGGAPGGAPGAAPGAAPGGPPEGGPGAGPSAGGPSEGGAPASSGASAVAAPPGATSKEGIYKKHAGDYDTALAIFDENLKKNPTDSLALYGKAWIQAERMEKPQAIGTFNQFLAVGKDKTKIKEARAAVSRLKAAGGATAEAAPKPSARPTGGAPPGGPGGPPTGGPGGPPG